MAQAKSSTLVIFNFTFATNPDIRTRFGTEQDVLRLRQVFAKLGFEVLVPFEGKEHEMTRDRVNEEIKNLSAKTYNDSRIFACAVLSHGNEGVVKCEDGQLLSMEELMRPFHECVSLKGKPKLFFIQACQGGKANTGLANVMVTQDRTPKTGLQFYETPPFKDFVVAYATYPGFFAYLDNVKGSCFIQSLCDAIDEESFNASPRYLVSDLLLRTNGKVRQIFEEKNKSRNNKIFQVTVTVSTLENTSTLSLL